jgi:hypothetical protein
VGTPCVLARRRFSLARPSPYSPDGALALPLLEQLEATLAGADESEAFAPLAFLASRAVVFDADDLNAARRRALLLLVAGGDPHRELELDGRAVRALAADLDAPEARAQLAGALGRLRDDATGLDRVSAALDALLAAPDLAWRWLAVALLAEELAAQHDRVDG